jgi:hypothetical protein
MGIMLAVDSHSVGLIDHLESANLRVIDATLLGFQITETLFAEFFADLAEKVSDLDPSKSAVMIQLLDNSLYECKLPNRDRLLSWRGRDSRTAGAMLRKSYAGSARTPCMIISSPFNLA